MFTFIQDIRFGLRTLAKSPGFAATAILTLAIGIGLNTAVFSVVNAMLFKRLPVRDPQELAGVYKITPGEFISHSPMSYPDYKDLRDRCQSFSGLIGYSFTALALDRGDESQILMGEQVTENYFQTLGVSAALGRTFQSEDGRATGDDPYVVLSDNTWKRRFAADPGIVGQTIRLNGVMFTVIGVAQQNFPGLFRGVSTDMWVPMMMQPVISIHSDKLLNRGSGWMSAMARLKPGVTLQRAQAEVQSVANSLKKEYPETNKDRNISLVAANDVKLVPGVDTILYAASGILMFIVGLVLLIACANVANMMLASATARRKEIAVRLAMGASRARLCRQLLTESLLIAIPGGALGILAAVWSNRALTAVRLPIPVTLALGLTIDMRVLLFTLGASVLTAVLFGLAPALRISRTDLAATLKEEGAAASGARAKRRLHSALVVAQVALSLVLLICAGLSIRSMQNAGKINPGFDPNGVVDASFDVGLRGYTNAQGAEFYRHLRERVSAIPGVESASYISTLPLSFSFRDTSAAPEGADTLPEKRWQQVDTADAGPGYFETMRIPLLSGRVFTERDTADSPPVAVVNQTLAHRFWPNQNPIGKRFRESIKGPYYEVIGVVADGKYRSLGEDRRSFVYCAALQNYSADQILVARTTSDSHALLAAIRQQARLLDEHIPIAQLQTVAETTSIALLLPRIGVTLFGLFGALAILLAAVGIYGIIAFAAGQRTQEIGIRIALGAQRSDILKMLIGHGLSLTLIGLAIGLGVAIAFTRVLSAILYGVGPTDLATLAGVSVFFILVSAIACYIPARRATRVDPLEALRVS
jgi:predicted permease